MQADEKIKQERKEKLIEKLHLKKQFITENPEKNIPENRDMTEVFKSSFPGIG